MKRGRIVMEAFVDVSPEHDVEYHLESVLAAFLNRFSIHVHELYPDAIVTGRVTSETDAAESGGDPPDSHGPAGPLGWRDGT